MPEKITETVVLPVLVPVPVAPRADGDEPPPPLVPFTCPWAQDGLRRALEGMGTASAGVSEYHIGSRGLHYAQAGTQLKTVDWWMKMVELFCEMPPLPSAVTGRDAACRVVMRDV